MTERAETARLLRDEVPRRPSRALSLLSWLSGLGLVAAVWLQASSLVVGCLLVVVASSLGWRLDVLSERYLP